jgi:hypothetical protein
MIINNKKSLDSVAKTVIAVTIFGIKVKPRYRRVTSYDHSNSFVAAGFRLRN